MTSSTATARSVVDVSGTTTVSADRQITGDRARHRRAGDPSAPWTGQIDVRGRRHAWVDAGRGLAILLVAFVHATEWLHTGGVDVGPWRTVNEILIAMRMPLFFAVAGMLGAGWLARGWSRTLSDKVGFLIWVYLVWLPIGLLATLMADQFTGHRQTPGRFLLAWAAGVVLPRAELWFLWALAAFFVLARITRHLPRPLQLAAAAAAAAVSLSHLFPPAMGWNGVPRFYLFFLLGLHLRDVLLWLADRLPATRHVGILLVTTWLTAAATTVLLDLDLYLGVGLAVRLLGLAAGVVLAVALSGSRLLRYLGSRTLPIYLAHTPFLLALTWAAHELRHQPLVAQAGLILPLITTAISIAASLALHAVLRRTPGRYAYQPPASITAALRHPKEGARAGSAG